MAFVSFPFRSLFFYSFHHQSPRQSTALHCTPVCAFRKKERKKKNPSARLGSLHSSCFLFYLKIRKKNFNMCALPGPYLPPSLQLLSGGDRERLRNQCLFPLSSALKNWGNVKERGERERETSCACVCLSHDDCLIGGYYYYWLRGEERRLEGTPCWLRIGAKICEPYLPGYARTVRLSVDKVMTEWRVSLSVCATYTI